MTAGDGESVRCAGGYVGALDEKVSGGRAACPSCGRVISFHRVTGKFKAHNVSRADG